MMSKGKDYFGLWFVALLLAMFMPGCGGGGGGDDTGHWDAPKSDLLAIEVTPPNQSIAKGTTQQFMATGIYADKTTKDLTASVTWSSSNTAIATISNLTNSIGLATGAAVGTITVTAIDPDSKAEGSTTLTVTAAVLGSIAVTPTNPSIANGKSNQFVATGTFSDNTTQDITASVTWTSSTTTIATISNTAGSKGLATGVAVGKTTIKAHDPATAKEGSTTLTVTAAVLNSIAVTPIKPSIAKGTTNQFIAIGTFSDNTTQDISTSVTWTSSAGTIATISNTAGSKGLATALAVGVSTIKAHDPASLKEGSTTLTVTAAVLTAIAVTPTNSSIPDGFTNQFTATGTFSDNTTQNITTSVTWSSSLGAIATISNALGSKGLATATALGATTIKAIDPLSKMEGSTTLTVTAAVLSSIAVTPANPSVANGKTSQFVATGTFSDNTTQDLTGSVTWSSSAVDKATISNAVGSKGLATGVAVGVTTIKAISPASLKEGSTTLTVTNAVLSSIAVTPTNPSIANGTTSQFTATGTFSDNTTQDITSSVTWSSATGTIATISNAAGSKGLASAVAVGASLIKAIDAATLKEGSTTLTVTAAVLSSIAVTPTNPSIANGLSKQFTATGTFSDNSTQDLTAAVTWSSSVGATATISNAVGSKGLASALAVGVTQIKAIDPATLKEGATSLTVTAAVLNSIAVTPTNPSVANGKTSQFMATGTFSDNTTQDLSASVTWTSSTGAVATISNAVGSKGLATGVTVGVTQIKAIDPATLTEGSTTLTVTAAVLSSIAVSPTNPSVANGKTSQFVATGTFSDNTTQDLTASVTWSSSAVTIATISNAAGSKGLASAIAVGATTIKAIDATTLKEGSTTLTVTAAVLSSIVVTPTNPSIANGNTKQFVATGTFSDNTTQDLTSSVTWSSANGTIATVSNVAGSNGLATALAVGASQIKAIDAATLKEGSTTLTVTAAVLSSIAVTPTNPSIANGMTSQFMATGTFSDNSTQDLTAAVTWSSSAGATATISNADGSKGLAKALAVGVTQIKAIDAATLKEGSTTLNVTAAVLSSLAVTPINPSIANGKNSQFIATGTFSDNTTQDLTSLVTWSSADGAIATISNVAGAKGLATAVAVGASQIKAIDPATLQEGTTTLTVTAAVLSSLAVTPINPSIANGMTSQFMATGTYSDNTTQDLTAAVTWSSSVGATATISNAAGSKGLATALALGVTQIKAIDPATLKEGTTPLTVTAAVLSSLAVTPTNPGIANGMTSQFMATGTFTDNTTQDLTAAVTWSSSVGATATISNAAGSKGLASALAVGVTQIKAIDPVTLKEGATNLTVTAAVLSSIAVTPTNPSIANGKSNQFTATGTYSDNTTQNITAAVTWSSSAGAIAAISNAVGSKGLATAASLGVTTIKAIDPSTLKEGTTTLTVTAAVLSSIAVSPTNPGIAKGNTKQFVATGTYSDNTTQDLTSSVTWSSADGTIATISNVAGANGLATALAVGTSQIKAIDPATLQEGSTTLTVTAAVLESIAVTPTNPNIANGMTKQFAAIGTFSDNTTQDLTAAVTWSSADDTIATISNALGSKGLATGIAVGLTTVKAIDPVSLKEGSTTLTVTAAVLNAIALTPVNPSIANGKSIQFVATGTFSDNTTQDLTSSVTWSSADGTIATISNAAGSNGLATAVAMGLTTIKAIDPSTLKEGTTTLTVTAAVLDSIAVTPVNPSIVNGTTNQFIATGTFSDNTTLIITSSVTWSSADELVATISNAVGSKGLATAVGVGASAIKAIDPATLKEGSTTLTVTAAFTGIDLKSATNFGTLAGTSITNNGGLTLISGDVGAYSQTVDPTQTAGYVNYKTDPVIANAVNDMTNAITTANAYPCDVSAAGSVDLGGAAMPPGVYCYAGAINITGTLQINGPGLYIFRTGSTLDTVDNSIVSYIGGATDANTFVYWVPVGATTMGANAAFKGTIMSLNAAITLGDMTTVNKGRMLTGAALTLKNNVITIP